MLNKGRSRVGAPGRIPRKSPGRMYSLSESGVEKVDCCGLRFFKNCCEVRTRAVRSDRGGSRMSADARLTSTPARTGRSLVERFSKSCRSVSGDCRGRSTQAKVAVHCIGPARPAWTVRDAGIGADLSRQNQWRGIWGARKEIVRLIWLSSASEAWCIDNPLSGCQTKNVAFQAQAGANN